MAPDTAVNLVGVDTRGLVRRHGCLLRCEHRDLTQPDLRARAAELQHRIDETPDQADAHAAADELHALLDDVANVEELPRPELWGLGGLTAHSPHDERRGRDRPSAGPSVSLLVRPAAAGAGVDSGGST
jgi:hypothetical protein